MAAFECLPDFFGCVPQLSIPDGRQIGKQTKYPSTGPQTIASS
ncbi:hypothetical protein EMIT0P4_90174 [Pseudomonas sp. IT-P4]